jgi:hypothetical protein
MFGNDLDLAARGVGGVRTLAVPQAVVFHAEAAHRGVRRTPLTGRHTHYQERRAACSPCSPTRRAGLVVGTAPLLRHPAADARFLVVRSVGEALDDLAALFPIYVSPGEIRAPARRARVREHDPAAARALVVPYRHARLRR